MKPYFLFCLWCLCISGTAQDRASNHTWHITARSGNTATGFKIHIHQSAGNIKVIYRKLDSTRQHLLTKDPAYIELRTSIQNATSLDEAEFQAEKLSDLVEKYSIYTTDTLTITGDNLTRLKPLLDSANSASSTTLENKAGNLNRPVISGFSFHIIHQTGRKKTVDLYVQSPDSISHPLLYHLVTETLNCYRTLHPDSFLNRKNTGGY